MIFKCTLNLLLDTPNKKLQTLLYDDGENLSFKTSTCSIQLSKTGNFKIILYMCNLSKFDLVTSKQINLSRMKSMHPGIYVSGVALDRRGVWGLPRSQAGPGQRPVGGPGGRWPPGSS